MTRNYRPPTTDPNTARIADALERIATAMEQANDNTTLDQILTNTEEIMSDQEHLDSVVSQLATGVTNLRTGLADVATEIQNLKDAQNANPTAPLDFGALDAVVGDVTSVATDLDNLTPTEPPADQPPTQ